MSEEINPIDEVIIGLLQGKDLEEEVKRIFFSKDKGEKYKPDEMEEQGWYNEGIKED